MLRHRYSGVVPKLSRNQHIPSPRKVPTTLWKLRNVSFYAEKLRITPKRLNQRLKEKLNKTITQVLHERLIKEAKHELFVSDKSIMEVSIKLGFSDKSYFSRFFRKMTRESPEGYKAKIKKKIHN